MYSRNSIKRELLIFSLGYLAAIKHQSISITTKYMDKELGHEVYTQDPLFRIRLLTWAENNKFDKEFCELIHSILELEDIKSILQDKFNNELNIIIDNVLSQLKNLAFQKGKEESLYWEALKSADLPNH